MIFINSSQNPVVKEVKALKEKKHREAKKLFFIEGIRFVEEALNEKVQINKVLISDHLNEVNGGNDIIRKLEISDFPLYKLPHKLFKEISDTENPQGVLAVLNTKNYTLDDIRNKNSFFVILDSIQDPGNLGTIIRTADAAGAAAVILSKGCVDVYNPKVLRSTMGSLFHIPVCYDQDIVKVMKEMKSIGIRLCAAHLEGSIDYFDLGLKEKVALIIGNEANGISEGVKNEADTLVKIPMPGRAESLNASVAAGLLIYEVARNRLKKRC